MIDKNIVLTGNLARLELLQETHRDTLRELSQDEKISTYSPALKLKFDDWFDKALKIFPESDQLAFIVRDLKSEKIIGSTRFYNICFNHKCLALGYTWYIPEMWGSGINRDCKTLLFNYAFTKLGINRIEFHVDARNQRSRAAVKKLGAVEEGILRQNIILDDGFVRDTVIYSILKCEWA